MYVSWKFLIALGFILWVALCLSDYYYTKHVHRIDYNEEEETEPVVIEPEIIEEEPDWFNRYVNRDFSVSETFRWSFLAFSCTTIICVAGQVLYKKIKLARAKATVLPIATDTELHKSTSISKIPILKIRHEAQSPFGVSERYITPPSNVSTQVYDNNKSCPDLTPKSSMIQNDSHKLLRASQSADRLRDEIVMLQATSFREQTLLSRKLESIAKEKRHLSNALANSLRENKSAKRKLDEIQRERGILLKQLESATREIKSNTRSKKLTLSRLEKAIQDSKGMKNEFVRLNEDKIKLEERVIELDKECKALRERRIVLNKSYMEIREVDGDSAIIQDKTTDEDSSLTSGGYYEVTEEQLEQSNIDMNKVQTKLNDLEKSLERLRFSSTIMKDANNFSSNNNTVILEEDEHNTGNDYKSDEEFDNESTESQNQNGSCDAVIATSASSIDIEDCDSLCLMPGCSKDHNLCSNQDCIHHHLLENDLGVRSTKVEKMELRSVTSTNQILLEAVKEKSAVLANMSSLFDTKEARARLAAFFTVPSWKKWKKRKTEDDIASDDKLFMDSNSGQREFDFEDWSPKLVPSGVVSQSPAFQRFLANIAMEQRDTMASQNMVMADG